MYFVDTIDIKKNNPEKKENRSKLFLVVLDGKTRDDHYKK